MPSSNNSDTSSDSRTASKSKHVDIDLTNKTTTDMHLDLLADKSKLKVDFDRKKSNSTSESDSSPKRKTSRKSSTSSVSSHKQTYGHSDILHSLKNMNGSLEQKTESKPQVVQERMVQEEVQEKVNPYYMMDEKQKRMKRLEVYSQLMELKTKHGIKLSKDYTINSDYEEMEFERDFHYNSRNRSNGVNLAKSFLLNGIQAVEFLNDRYNPFKFKLNGWHDHMASNIEDFNEVLAELYEKYKGSGKKMEPEVRFVLMILFSGFTFHASQVLSKNIPGLDEAIRNNPSLLGKLQNTVYASMAKDPQRDKDNQVNAQQQEMYRKMQEFKQAREAEVRQAPQSPQAPPMPQQPVYEEVRLPETMAPRPPAPTDIEDELQKRQQLYTQSVRSANMNGSINPPSGSNNRAILDKIKQQYGQKINQVAQQAANTNEGQFINSLKQPNSQLNLPTQSVMPVPKQTVFARKNSPTSPTNRNRLIASSTIDTSSDEMNSSMPSESNGSRVGSRRKPKGMVISIDTK
jgi:hypothetical protein